jgi:hypothetical protein
MNDLGIGMKILIGGWIITFLCVTATTLAYLCYHWGRNRKTAAGSEAGVTIAEKTNDECSNTKNSTSNSDQTQCNHDIPKQDINRDKVIPLKFKQDTPKQDTPVSFMTNNTSFPKAA